MLLPSVLCSNRPSNDLHCIQCQARYQVGYKTGLLYMHACFSHTNKIPTFSSNFLYVLGGNEIGVIHHERS